MQSKYEDNPLLAPNVDQSSGRLIPWVLQKGLQMETEKNVNTSGELRKLWTNS